MSDDHEPLEELEAGIARTMSYVYETVGPEHEAHLLEALCEGYVRANQIQVRAQDGAYPCCLGCGNYRYVPPSNCKTYDYRKRRSVDPQCQQVLGAAPLHRKKEGTCIDLACYLCALIREKDGDRQARVGIDYQFDEAGRMIPGKYHAIVVKGDGQILDPQRQLEELAARKSAGGSACAGAADDGAIAVGSCGCSARPNPSDDPVA